MHAHIWAYSFWACLGQFLMWGYYLMMLIFHCLIFGPHLAGFGIMGASLMVWAFKPNQKFAPLSELSGSSVILKSFFKKFSGVTPPFNVYMYMTEHRIYTCSDPFRIRITLQWGPNVHPWRDPNTSPMPALCTRRANQGTCLNIYNT